MVYYTHSSKIFAHFNCSNKALLKPTKLDITGPSSLGVRKSLFGVHGVNETKVTVGYL